MTIDKIDVNVCSPGRNFVTLKIVTGDGVVGWGDATLNGRELSVAAYLSEHLASTLIGRDEDRIEDTWQYLYRGAYWRRGPVTMAAIAAVDMALWDIKAKKAGVPLYQLFGGASPRPHSGVRSRLRPRLRCPQRLHQRLHRGRLHRCARTDRRARTRTDLRCRHR